MGTKTEWIAKAAYQPKPEDIDIDKAWNEAKVWMSEVGVTISSKPDVKKIRDAMAKQKKGMEFVATWDGRWIEIEATVGGKSVDKEGSQDMSAGGDQKKWRAAMGELRKVSKLVTDADLKAFDAKHPDPDKVATLKARADSLERDIKIRNQVIKRQQDELKPKLEELQRLLKEIKTLGG